ncbi:MAG: hypothetical protein HY553_06420 [Elusimicrobia bacterium]|nr:hypothetical protein [Elusimicrobiota bacterium]
MGLNDKLLQLAFGRAIPEMSYCIGIYLSGTTAYVSEVRLSGGKPKVEHLVKVPIPPPKDDKQGTKVGGALNTDILADTDRLAGLLKQAMAAAGKWRSEYAVVTLSHTFGILRYFVMPAIEQKFWRMAVPAEAKKYIPVQFEDLVTDFQIEAMQPGPDRRPRQGVVFGVTQGKNLEYVRLLLAKLGVKLAGVEISPLSVTRMWDALEPPGSNPYAHVHFDQGDVHVVLNERGLPIFVRELLMGQDAKVADRRKLDLTGCLDFAKKQLGAARPAKVRISGETAERAAWQEQLGQEFQLKVDFQDTPKLLGIKGGEWGAYASIGAGLRCLQESRLSVDLSAAGRIDDNDRRTATSIFVGGGLIGAVFLGFGIYLHAQAIMNASELSRLRSRGLAVPAFQGKTSVQIEAMVNDMRQRSQSLSSITASGLKATNILERLAENIPEQTWLSGFTYSHSLEAAVMPSAGGAPRTLTLTGNVSGASQAAEQDTAIRFKEQLQRDEKLQKAFPSIQISVSAAGGGSPGSEATRTGFTITCQGRGGG